IYVKEKAVLVRQHQRAYEALPKELAKEDTATKARAWMCQNFYDVRTFGAVMSLKEFNCGQVRGPVQLAFAESQDAIVPLAISITRMAVATELEAAKQGGGNRTMGRKSIVPYGLYRAHGFISAHLAEQTGFTEDDLRLFWEALQNMFDHDRSAARGQMAPQKLVVFRHDSKLGNAPAHKLFERVQVQRRDPSRPPRSVADYKVTVNKEELPEGITVDCRI
ncbi:MAG: type I-C CRISPR-associated protein Cas7/Csd2, partial [Chloroflexi bacterium]|nr:type I-C CRISPR-associated protein Cas7/Csd2 [Chloroflexota bacterium]